MNPDSRSEYNQGTIRHPRGLTANEGEGERARTARTDWPLSGNPDRAMALTRKGIHKIGFFTTALTVHVTIELIPFLELGIARVIISSSGKISSTSGASNFSSVIVLR